MAVKILHAADLHMDSPFDALTEEKAVERRREQRELMEKIAAVCEEEKVQVVLLAGDLLDSAMSYYETHDVLIRAFSQISAEIFISPGNHDYYCAKSPYAFLKFPANVHIFRSPILESVTLEKLGCRIWGAGFNAPVCPPLLDGFSVQSQPDMVDILVIHGELGGESYNPIQESGIAGLNVDYLALGHTHTFSGFLKAGDTTYAYPGCPEGRGFDELGEKGVILGTVDKGKCDLRFVPVGKRQYKIWPVDLTGATDVREAVISALPENSSRDIYRLVLTGEFGGELDLNALKESLTGEFYSLNIKDETRPLYDIWTGLQENTLKGLFLNRMRERYDVSSEAERRTISKAVRYALGALENREEWRP